MLEMSRINKIIVVGGIACFILFNIHHLADIGSTIMFILQLLLFFYAKSEWVACVSFLLLNFVSDVMQCNVYLIVLGMCICLWFTRQNVKHVEIHWTWNGALLSMALRILLLPIELTFQSLCCSYLRSLLQWFTLGFVLINLFLV